MKSNFSDIISFAEKDPDKRVGLIFQLRYVEGKNNNVMPWRMISETKNEHSRLHQYT